MKRIINLILTISILMLSANINPVYGLEDSNSVVNSEEKRSRKVVEVISMDVHDYVVLNGVSGTEPNDLLLVSKSFNSATLLLEGDTEPTIVTDYQEFIALGFKPISNSGFYYPCKLGDLDVMCTKMVFKLDNVPYEEIIRYELPANTEYVIHTQDIEIYNDQVYEVGSTFLSLDISLQNGQQQSFDFESFLDVTGTVTSDVPDSLSEGTYKEIFQFADDEKSADVVVKSRTIKREVEFNDQNTKTVVEVENGERIDVNDIPTPIGKPSEYFVGWFTGENDLGDKFDESKPIESNIVLYAFYEENVVISTIETKDVSLLTTDTYNPADGFVSMTITTNGVPKSYTYDQFQTMGGTTSSITMPLKAGTQTVTYAYGTESKTATLHITDYSFTAKDLSLKESDSYTPEDSFVELVITDPQGMKTSHDLEKFEALGGTVTTNVPTPLSEGTYQTVYTLNGVSETSTIEVEADDIQVEIETKDVSLLTTDTYNPADGFVSMTITTNGVPKSYTYDQFQTMGGTTSSITTPLKAGTQTVTYAYGNESETSTLHITDYSFTVENLTIKESETYKPEDSFEELVITDPQGMKTSHDLEKFEALGGTVTTNVPTPLSEGIYQTVYTLNGVSETSTIEVEADDIQVEIETKDVSLLTTDTYNPADGFVSMTITTNGVPESYTYDQFQTMGGTTSSITTPLKAGTQTVTYAYGNESETSTLHITDYSFTAKDLSLKESDSYTPEDSFVELVITDPQGMKTSHDLEKFGALGGTVTSNVPTPLSEGTYQTVYTLNGVSETATIEVESDDIVIPEVLDVTFVDKNHSTIALVEANKLINSHDIPEIHPEKGETFVGWFTEKNGAGVEFNPMTELVTESMVVYAHYETSVYTVLFEVNGTITKTAVKHGYNIDPDMVPNPEMPNLKFIGWERISISRMFQEQPQYFDIENDIVTDNMMLRAVYEDDEVLPEEPQEPQEPETPEKTDEVKESKKETLPITGLTQTSVASYIGLIVMIAGLVLLIISRKKRNENK